MSGRRAISEKAAYAREKGDLGESSICPGEGAVLEEAVYVRERGISAEAVFCKALLTKTFPIGRRM